MKLSLTTIALAASLLAQDGGGGDDNCKGCNLVCVNTVNSQGLVISFPATKIPGDCRACPGCGACHADPCTFDGTFQIWNDSGPLGPTFHYKKNGQDGSATLGPGQRHPVVYNSEQIDCGNVDVYDNWRRNGQPIPGVVKLGCSKCPETGDGSNG